MRIKVICYREGVCEECGCEHWKLIETTLGWICPDCFEREQDRL